MRASDEEHDDRGHEELLAALLAGDRSPDDPEVGARLRDCTRCRVEWERLRPTADELTRAAFARDEALAAQAKLAGAPGEERLLATLDAAARARRRPRFLRVVLLVGVAAAALAGWWRWSEPPPERTHPARVLGARRLVLLQPSGNGADFSRFTWEYDGNAVAFELRVFALVDGERGEECIPEQRCRGTSWTPDAELLARMPAAIEWEVSVVLELENGPVASQRAWR